jgi:hypothetical protein
MQVRGGEKIYSEISPLLSILQEDLFSGLGSWRFPREFTAP